MRVFIVSIAAALAFVPLIAQEGHPLSGTWHGTWNPAPKQDVDLTFVMNWDGKEITGLINPGFDGMQIQNASLDPEGWKVHVEAQSKDGRIVADGRIENVTNARRQITGTWSEGSRRGPFKLVRDN